MRGLREHFEGAYGLLCDDLLAIGLVPPSREIILEHARRSATMTVFHVIAHWRTHLRAPEIAHG